MKAEASETRIKTKMRLNYEEFCHPSLEVSSLRGVNDENVFTPDDGKGKGEMCRGRPMAMSILGTNQAKSGK